MKLTRIISASLSPNVEKDDLLLAIKLIIQPWLWRNGSGQKLVEAWFNAKFPNYTSFTFNSGRSAEYEILKAFGIGAGDEVIVQAFTCVAVPNSVIWNQVKPVYADIDDSLNATSELISKKITQNTKAIIVQHTFGNPSKINEIIKLARKHNLVVIEDCAHALGVAVDKRLLGSFGDAAFFSFGRDKVVSSVFGGVAIINSKHKHVIESMNLNYNLQKKPRLFWIFQQLFHPLAFAVILPFYNLYLGKILLVLLQKLNLLSYPVYSQEKKAKQPEDFPALLPNALALLAHNQLKKLPKFISTRRNAQERYWEEIGKISKIKLPNKNENVVYLRFPILYNEAQELFKYAKTQGVILGNWYKNSVDPNEVNYKAIAYNNETTPNAERIVKNILNLPTRINNEEVTRVIMVIQKYFNEK